MSDLRSAILSSEDLPSEKVDVTEWGVTVELRGMSGTQRGKFLNQFSDENGTVDYGKLQPFLLVMCMYNPGTGEPVFTEDDLPLLMNKAGQVLDRLGKRVMYLSGMGDEATKQAAAQFPN